MSAQLNQLFELLDQWESRDSGGIRTITVDPAYSAAIHDLLEEATNLIPGQDYKLNTADGGSRIVSLSIFPSGIEKLSSTTAIAPVLNTTTTARATQSETIAHGKIRDLVKESPDVAKKIFEITKRLIGSKTDIGGIQ